MKWNEKAVFFISLLSNQNVCNSVVWKIIGSSDLIHLERLILSMFFLSISLIDSTLILGNLEWIDIKMYHW